MVMRRTLRFMLSQFSSDLSSAMRLSSSSWTSVGAITPASGTPIGPQRLLRNSNGTGGWSMGRGLKVRAAFSLLLGGQKIHHPGAARHCFLVAQIRQRFAGPPFEEQKTREDR